MSYEIMRAHRIIIAACAVVVLTGCQAAERFRNNMTRRLQSAAVCSLLSITASPDSAADDPASEPAPVQVRRASRSPEQASPAPARTERREAARMISSTAPRRVTTTMALHQAVRVAEAESAIAKAKTMSATLRARRVEMRESLVELPVRQRLTLRKMRLPVSMIEPIESVVIESLPVELTPPSRPEPCSKSRHQEPAPAADPVAESMGGPGSSCGPDARFACADAAPQR